MNNPKIANLDQLLQQDQNANQFFCSLPNYAQEFIRQRGDHIRCAKDLHRYAENFLECM